MKFICFCFNISADAQVQDTVLFSYKTYGLENDSLNVIQNNSYLDDFYESIYLLKKKQDTVINIIHLGDSHVQADFLTSIVRRNFHERFGNAGRGLVFPARVAGTNEAFNIVSSSTVLWAARRIVQPAPSLPIGISGITMRCNQPGAKLNIYMRDLWLDYSFNKVTLFYAKSDSSFDFIVRDTANNELGKIHSVSDEFKNHQTVAFRKSVDAVSFETVKNNPVQTYATIFGVVLENSNPGIEYHAIGVNGAKYEQYNKAEYFAEQLSVLKPSLIIISLGTNESLASPTLDKGFLSHVDSLVTHLNNLNPRAKIILTTPQETFRKRVRPNPGSLIIRNEIIQYAVENGYAFWDCYSIMGGAGSANAWRKAALLRPDGVHLTIQGYEYQGDLFFNALMKGYNNYVSVRHP
jgi:lysophospholipase L1-like esterase